MIGVLLFWAFMATASYSVYSMYTAAAASNSWGLVYSGIAGGVLTLIIDGYSHISTILDHCLAFTANYGEWTFLLVFVAFWLVLLWNGITTQGQTLVQ